MNSLVFFGDFVCKSPESIKFGEKLKTWVKADYVACNFEAPISVPVEPAPKSGPSLSQSPQSPACLESLGINIIQLANNHMMDYGSVGVEETINSFKHSTLLGAGYGKEIYNITIVECGEKKIGLLSLVQHEFGTLDGLLNENQTGTAWINHPLVNEKIRSAKEVCDYLFVLPHAGFENIDAPLPEWRQRYKEFVDLGADAVIASHPHVPQGWEIYKGRPIYYSLGNFCFDKITSTVGPYWTRSLAVKIILTDEGKLSFEVKNIVFREGVIEIDDTEEIKKHNDYLCKLLLDTELFNQYIEKKLDDSWDSYKLMILRGLGAIGFGLSASSLMHAGYGIIKGQDIPMLLNNFQCETHNWAIQNILRRKMKK